MVDILMLRMDEIRVGEHRVRMTEDDPRLDDLCESIKRVGLLNPLGVRRADDGYDLAVGHRRYAACRAAGLREVPVRVLDGDASRVRECIFAENYHRADISPVEQAAAISEAYASGDMSTEDIGRVFRRTVDWVKRQIAMLDWPMDVLEQIHRRQLNVSAGSWLARVTDDVYREYLVRTAVENGASARTCEAWYHAWASQMPADEAVQQEGETPQHAALMPAPTCPCLFCGQSHPVDGLTSVLMCLDCSRNIRDEVARR